MIDLTTPFFAIDVGRGTQDILVYEPGRTIENSIKLVLPSPTVIVAGKVRQATRAGLPIFLEGFLMGGGANTGAIREHLAAGLPVYATPEAAGTLHDDPERVRAMGVDIRAAPPGDAVRVRTTDYMEPELRQALSLFGVDYPENVAVAVQDHGYSPHRSNRIHRFELMRERLDAGEWDLTSLASDPPLADMTRMQAVRRQAPDGLVTDTGPVALIGALCDPQVRRMAMTGVTLVNAGNGHTLCFTLKGREIHGLFEHHTGALDPAKLQDYIRRLADGTLTSEEVFDDGGHGAAIRRPLKTRAVVVTGPNRLRLLPDAYQAAPFGDMMLSGCFGLAYLWKVLREATL
ncbi:MULTISPECIES: DUF1786 domain-containing protein [unclassified Methanoculleus]|uniref:DUF1786 domain-containing protein n=1 Tax=unclassified Methanoculleus TaxID=2619537 RepID=UPI0025D6134B|nr:MULTISPECIES: DUF1786 domain-containing protein [unclassified Methanoculleus]MCK9319025.1 DUF1786 domain-containing protein [Methanoculleus sp.]MDD2254201.1 DUF1786 domain-containing protein [Methanoculleus sp.]MDD2786831.1 DUF1786 domain-containing protein [Methanoculleus sp.]MDD3217007.1 DUF1786 domain-containing protein [Methanoculleus sp.]MDD4314178.1 DUF1786 domain-containing protein [Methanoculleus sp.]